MIKVIIDNVQPNEFLYILRHRLKINQVEMAANLKITRHILSKIELEKQAATFFIKDLSLTQVEKCILLRRRAGKNQGQLSFYMGVSRTWVNHMETERSNPARLLEYWSS